MLKKILNKIKSYLPVSRKQFNKAIDENIEALTKNVKLVGDLFKLIESFNERDVMIRTDMRRLYDSIVAIGNKVNNDIVNDKKTKLDDNRHMYE